MRNRFCSYVIVLLILSVSTHAYAYGGGGSSSSGCQEPQFTSESPAANSTVKSIQEFSFIADNADSLQVEVNGHPIPADVSPQMNGTKRVVAKLPQAITQAGRVRITVSARSPDDCASFQPYYIEVTP